MQIWIDTDIGGDIDDAMALLLAAASEELRIIGVSTVFENTTARARIAKAILAMCGRGDIPVYAGERAPRAAKYVHGLKVNIQGLPKTYLSEFDAAEIEKTDAVEALKNALEANAGLTVVTMGALTNMARLIEKYPETAKKIDCLYIMGGAKNLNLNEFNLTCDPEAADIVFKSDIAKKIITLDVTFQCGLNKRQAERLKNCGSKALRTVMEMCDLWNGDIILHDPLALGAAICGDFVSFVNGNLKVELEGEYSRGKCIDLCDFNWRQPPRADVLVSETVASTGFTDFYVSRICALDQKLTAIESRETPNNGYNLGEIRG